MNRLLLLFFTVLFLLAGVPAQCQDFPMLHYTVEDGLPGNTVYDIYRKSNGFLWIATDKGVARFNGIKFETFSTANGLPDNDIFFIQEDNYGRVWFGSFNGALCYYKNDTFHNANNTPFLKLPVQMTHTRHISVEYDSSLIISFHNQNMFVTINGSRSKIFYLDSMHRPDITATLVFRKRVAPNRYKLICSDKIVIIDTLCHIISEQKIDLRFENPDLTFCGCQNTEYMFNQQCLYTPAMQLIREFPRNLIKNSTFHQAYVSGDKIFYGTSEGVLVNDTLHLLKGCNATTITQDNNGNYWIATLNKGIFVLRKNFLNTFLVKDAYRNACKYAIPGNGRVLFATEVTDVYSLKGKQIEWKSENAKSDFDFPLDFGFTADEKRIYCSYRIHQFSTYDLHTGRKHLIVNPLISAAKIMFIDGSYIYEKLPYAVARVTYEASGKITDVKTAGKDANNERIFGMAKAGDNAIWYSTVGGMYRIAPGDTSGVLQPQFRNINFKYFDFFGNYLVGYTQDNMLLVCRNYSSAKIVADTIPPARCVWNKLYKIDDSHILISTNNLHMLLTIERSGDREKFRISPIENPFIPLHAEAVCCTGNNCYFFKDHSITIIDNNTILEKPAPPVLHFAFLKTGKHTYPIDSSLQVSFNESRHLGISFTTQSFSGRDVQYQYSFSKNGPDVWRDVKGEEINIVNSGYGTYFIRVRARSLSSDYSKPVVFTLNILKPFWATWWFVSLFTLLVILISVYAVRLGVQYLIRKKERKYENEIKFMRSEYKALNALMNPHFIFNTLNNVQGLVNRNDKLAANEYIRVFADIIRQNMHNIAKELIPLQKEIDLVSNYLLLEKLRFKDHLNYTINIEDGLDLSEVMVPPLLVQPLVENSIKHGILPLESESGRIVINIYESEAGLHIDVRDNGVGLTGSKNTDHKHESFGLENVRRRIEQLSMMLNKQIEFSIREEKDPAGVQWTVVSILIAV